VMDWFSRYVLSWAVSITMDVGFCLEALEQALQVAHPEIFNSDQGAQFTRYHLKNLGLKVHPLVGCHERGKLT